MPVHPDKKMRKCLLQNSPVDPSAFRTSQTLRLFSEFACCSKGDVVLVKDDMGFKAGQIWWVASVYDTCVALIFAWDVVTVTGTSATWSAVDRPELYAADDILDACIWKRCGDVVTTLLPPSVRMEAYL